MTEEIKKTVRRFQRDLTSCMFCPEIIADENVTRWLCGKTRAFICWMSDEREENKAPIPDNCPLPVIIPMQKPLDEEDIKDHINHQLEI